jgi:hypothetical protein
MCRDESEIPHWEYPARYHRRDGNEYAVTRHLYPSQEKNSANGGDAWVLSHLEEAW